MGVSLKIVKEVTGYLPQDNIPDDNTSWFDTSGSVTTSLGKIVPTTTASGWSRASGAFGSIPSNTDGFVEFNPVYMVGQSSSGRAIFGLNDSTSGASFVSFGIYLEHTGNIRISEGSNPWTPAKDTWTVSDTLRVERVGTTIYYKKNGAVFYTSLISSSQELFFDCSINQYLGAENLQITHPYLATYEDSIEFDLLESETINIQKTGVSVENLGTVEAGTTNSFTLPYTPHNNNIFDNLELVGTTSNFPYEDNFVKYTEDGIELITNGRLKVTEFSEKGYEVDIIHGINDFFDKIRGKFLWQAYEPYRTTLQQMVSAQTTLCNTTTVRDNEGYCVPLIDLAGVNPIADYQQTVGYYLKFGMQKIADAIDYTVSYDGINLEDYVFTHNKLPSFDARVNNFSGVYKDGTELEKDMVYTLYQFTMQEKAVLNFQQISITCFQTFPTRPFPLGYVLRILVNGVSVHNVLTSTTGTSNETYTSPSYLNKGDIVQVVIDTEAFNAGSSMVVTGFFNGLYTTDGDVYHENILGDYSQTDFIKNIMEVFNAGVTVNGVTKEIELYSLNNVYQTSGIINDLTRYYDRTKTRSFTNEYGKNNLFKYKYLQEDADFADGIMVANNTSEDKTIIDSDLTASEVYTNLTLGNYTVKLVTAKGYDAQDPNAKNNAIGYRISKVGRVIDGTDGFVSVSYINGNGITSSVNSDQTYLSFDGLDWPTIINTRYNNLQNNILNQYVKHTVYMNCPKYIINEYDFKEKVYIKDLGSRFVVSKISTLKGGMSEWELIKIN